MSLLLSVGWLPPSLPPSGACLTLGTSMPAGLFTPSRVPPHRGCASSESHGTPSELLGQWRAVCWPYGVTGTWCTMAHIHPTRARARATTTWCACGPRATRQRARVPRRPCACQLRFWRALDGFARRRGRWRLTFAGERYAPAPATRAPRAWVWPAWVSAPCRRRSPLEEADGSRPQHGISCLGLAKRVRAPRAAPGVTAPVPGPPRKAWSASTTGYQRQAVPCSWRAGARRPRRSGCAGTARPSSGKTMGCAGVGQTPAESHRRCAGPQLAPPV